MSNHTNNTFDCCGCENTAVSLDCLVRLADYSDEVFCSAACRENFVARKAAIRQQQILAICAPLLLRELKSAIFYIESFGGDVTANFAAGGNLDQIKRLIAKAEDK